MLVCPRPFAQERHVVGPVFEIRIRSTARVVRIKMQLALVRLVARISNHQPMIAGWRGMSIYKAIRKIMRRFPIYIAS